ncbi:MAG: hypothetical protein WBH40_01895 [Ignavibacteriaceae bacterium]|jgi:hypothetical protein
MIGFLKIVLFFILFLFIIKLLRSISKYRSSSRQTIDDLENQQRKEAKQFGDVEDAEYREIPPEKKNESENN